MHKYLIMALLIALAATSCSEKDITAFKANEGINFIDTNEVAYEYSFLGNPAPEHVYELPVVIIGNAADHDRKFTAQAVKDSATTAPDDLYEILGGYVKAGQFRGYLQVKLKNAPQLAASKVSLRVKLTAGGDFEAGNADKSTFIVRWTEQIVVPSWSFFRYYFTTAGSTQAYKLIVQTTGLKTLTNAEHRALTPTAVQAMGTVFGDYVKQWNLDHPNDHLKHDDGTLAGQEIVPIYYTRSKYD
jgi:hypothetical protein